MIRRGEPDNEASFLSMSEDGRNILLEVLRIVISKTKGRKSNFPKTFIESTIGYVGNPSKNGALKELGYYTVRTWKNNEYYPECSWKFSFGMKKLWENSQRNPRIYNLESIIELGDSHDIPHPYLDRLLVYKRESPDSDINLETFVFKK
jgi:hypothetical protein